MDANALAKIKEFVGSAQNILIVTHEHPTPDSIGSSLALMLGLTSLGKKVTIACPDAITVALSSFIGVNKIQTDIDKKNFIISLDYVDGSIEKVSYNIEGDKFNLVIEPRPGFESLTQDKVNYSYGGAAADLVITVDTIHLGGLKKLYESDKELYTTKSVINIDRHPNNSNYGTVNLVDSSVSSTSELVSRVMSFLGVRLTEDIATNILNAVIGATNNFQNPTVSAGAFELVAACMKAGGKRFAVSTGDVATQQNQLQPVSTPLPKPPSQTTPIQQAPSVSHQPEPAKTAPSAPPAVQDVTTQTPQPPKPAPADWLKPKIFKSSNLS